MVIIEFAVTFYQIQYDNRKRYHLFGICCCISSGCNIASGCDIVSDGMLLISVTETVTVTVTAYLAMTGTVTFTVYLAMTCYAHLRVC